MTSPVAHNI